MTEKKQETRNKSVLVLVLCLLSLVSFDANAVKVVASVNGNPVTDADITERTKIMPASLDNRERAKEAIIEDYIKLEYAKQFKIEPDEKEVAASMKEHKDNPQMKLFTRATLAWQMTIMRTIVPSISVGEKEIADEMNDLERARGLPYDMTFIRLVDVPKDIYKKLEKPKSCAEAEAMARKLGGEPQRIAALEYELAPELREQFVGLADFTWSPLKGKKTVLVCNRKKTDEWKKMDEAVRQNAIYKRALFQSDQLLKQLRRKAVIN
ncbi:MAG: hypothetical protein LBT45_02240 [Rickettsiales bacterium]|nr:hypothetical protein [Rickettsiales bacterium]